MRRRLAFVPLAFLAVACAEDPTGSQELTPSFDQDQVVYTTENTGPFVTLDPEHGWQVVIGNDPRRRCAGNPTPPQFVEVQRITSGNSGKVQEHIKGSGLEGQIWGFTQFDCARFLSEDPVAEGTVDLEAENYFQFWTGQQPDRWSFRAQGAAFNVNLHCVWDPPKNRSVCNQDHVVLIHE